MFGGNVVIPKIAHLAQLNLQYLADKSSLLSIEMLIEAYILTAMDF